MDIPLNAEVRCSDGPGGHSIAIIANPRTLQVTHFVTEYEGAKSLVPVDAIVHSSSDAIVLRWSRAKLANAEPFEKMVFDESTPPMDMTGAYVSMYGTPDREYIVDDAALAYQRREQVPVGELAIHRHVSVEAADGRAGQVDGFVVDPASGQIESLVLRHGHLWGKRDVIVPVSAIKRVEQDAIVLTLDKAAVEQLSRRPAH